MSPETFRNEQPTHWPSLVSLWSELSRCSRRSAGRNLIDNSQGDYSVVQKDGKWIFHDINSGFSYSLDEESGEWNDAKV